MKRIFLYLLIMIPVVVTAQRTMTLDECVWLAKENNKEIKASEHQYRVSRYEQNSARSLFFPSFLLTGNVVYSTSDGSYASGGGMLPVLGVDGLPSGQTAFFQV